MVFRVGQKVVCVNDGPQDGYIRGFDPDEAIVKGEVYTIIRLMIGSEGFAVVHLHEIRRNKESREYWGDDCGYCVKRFRPVVSTKSGMAILEQIRRDVTNKTALPIREDEQV